MTTRRRLTRPGRNDNEFMVVTATPDRTAVQFEEYQQDAEDVARANLHPGVTTYVGKVLLQGEHTERGTAKHVALLVEIDRDLERALRARGCLNAADRRAALYRILGDALTKFIAETPARLPGLRNEPFDARTPKPDVEARIVGGVLLEPYPPPFPETKPTMKPWNSPSGGLRDALNPPSVIGPSRDLYMAGCTMPGCVHNAQFTLRQLREQGQPLFCPKCEAEQAAIAKPPEAQPAPPTVSCHGGNRCSNWPACESCGPARL
jgi:hypothetical protein